MSDKIRVKPENYFIVQGWMITELRLKGNALMLYAIIYGFSQTENTAFTGSIDYLCDWLGGVSRPTVINTLDTLVEQGLLSKKSTTKGALIYNSYTAIVPSKEILFDSEETSKKTLSVASKEILHNNNSIDNKELSLPKGKEEQAPPEATKKKSYREIFDNPINAHIKEALRKFIEDCEKRNIRFRVSTVEKFASILRDNAKDDPALAMAMVDQSIERGWKSIYPLKNYYKGNIGKKEAVSVPVSKEDKAKNPDGSYVTF